MARFGQYEDEFLHICATLRLKMKQVGSLAGERKKLAEREAEREISEAEDILREMGDYARSQAARGLDAKLRGYESDLQRLRREFQRAVRSGANRDELFGDAGDDEKVLSLNQRSALLADRQTLNSGVDRLKNTRAIVERTNEIGTNVLNDLDGQRNSLLRANDSLDNTDQHITRGRRILRAMDRRIMTNQLVLILIAFFLAVAIGICVYLFWFGPISIPGGATTTTTTMTTTSVGNTTQAPAPGPTTAS